MKDGDRLTAKTRGDLIKGLTLPMGGYVQMQQYVAWVCLDSELYPKSALEVLAASPSIKQEIGRN